MSARPKPLANLATGYPLPDSPSLTPRTPHSRSVRAEDNLGGFHGEQYEEEDVGTYQQQLEPLLASSASASFPESGFRSRAEDHALDTANRKPLKISATAKRITLVLGVVFVLILSISTIVVSTGKDSIIASSGSDALASKHDDVKAPSSLPLLPHNLGPNVISYENYTKFPHLPGQYVVECNKLMHGFMHHGKYWAEDSKDVQHSEQEIYGGSKICNGTITYQLGGDVGLLADLGLMAQVAGLARERNKTFLIDDTYWNRGSWTDHFEDVRSRQPGPEPGCTAPPPEELVACPRTARHWIVTARTAQYHLGHGFSDHYVNAYGHELNRLKPIFNTALQSFTETIQPNAHIVTLIKLARDEIDNLAGASGRQYIGLHLRRGDRPAVSWRYKGGYVPIPEFIQAIKNTASRLFSDNESTTTIYVASDSPSAEAELIDALPSGTLTLSLLNSRWRELTEMASRKEYVQREFNELEETERVNLTRGALVDFAMLSGLWASSGEVTPKATICTLSSSICKLSAIGLGWDHAFGEVDEMGNIDDQNKGWVEIDNASQIDPVWEAFELFI